jgi:hypothetical protein
MADHDALTSEADKGGLRGEANRPLATEPILPDTVLTLGFEGLA